MKDKKLKRKCKIGNKNIGLKLEYMNSYNLVKVTVSFNTVDVPILYYKISTIVENNKNEIEDGITLLLRKAEKGRKEKYTISKSFTEPFKEDKSD